MKRQFISIIIALAVGALLISPAPVTAARIGFGVTVGTPPPVPVAIGPVGVAPGPGYVWIDGYWDWVNGGWVWVPGRWALPPRAHAMWVGPVYRHVGGRVRYFRGHWN